MARRRVVRMLDDIDGSEIEAGAGETLVYGLDGTEYEIDLKREHADELREMLAPYIVVSRVRGRGHGTDRAPAAATRTAESYDRQALREWARSNGVPVAERGRVKREVVEQYLAQR